MESVGAEEIVSRMYFRDGLGLREPGPASVRPQQLAVAEAVVYRPMGVRQTMVGLWQSLVPVQAEGQGCHSSGVIPLAHRFLYSHKDISTSAYIAWIEETAYMPKQMCICTFFQKNPF